MLDQTIYQSITADWSAAKKQRLPEEFFQYFQTTGSTNDVLLVSAKTNTNTPTTQLAVAEHQTAGRGRRGDAWLAPNGKNLLFSVLLPLTIEKRYWTRIPQFIAWTMGRTIETVIDPGLKIEAKWPNDLYLEGKKLGGILIETSLEPNPVAVIGLGLNVNIKGDEFPHEIREIATSLYSHIGCESNRWYLLGQFMDTLLGEFPEKVIEFDDCLSWIRKRDYLRDRKVLIKQSGMENPANGIARGIGDEGELLVETGLGIVESIFSAERLVLC